MLKRYKLGPNILECDLTETLDGKLVIYEDIEDLKESILTLLYNCRVSGGFSMYFVDQLVKEVLKDV